jgi:hypothetical protein
MRSPYTDSNHHMELQACTGAEESASFMRQLLELAEAALVGDVGRWCCAAATEAAAQRGPRISDFSIM